MRLPTQDKTARRCAEKLDANLGERIWWFHKNMVANNHLAHEQARAEMVAASLMWKFRWAKGTKSYAYEITLVSLDDKVLGTWPVDERGKLTAARVRLEEAEFARGVLVHAGLL